MAFTRALPRIGQGEALACSVATSIDDITALRDEWRALAQSCRVGNVYCTWEWAEAWYRSEADQGQIRCLLVRNSDGQMIGLAPLFLPRRGDGNLGTRELGFMGTYGHSWGHYPEFLLAPGQEQAALGAILSRLLERPDWRLLRLMRVDPDSQLLRRLTGLAPTLGLQVYIQPGLCTSCLDLPSDPTAVVDALATPEARNHYRVVRKRLAADLPQARLRMVTDRDEMEVMLARLGELNSLRHEVKGVESNFNVQRYRQCFFESHYRFLEAGWLRVHALEIGDTVIAVTSATLYGRTLTMINSGFDAAYASYRPNLLILVDAMTRAVEDGGQRLDLQTWYPYKSAICRERRQLLNLLIFPQTWRGQAPALRDLATKTVRAAAKAILPGSWPAEHPGPRQRRRLRKRKT